MRENILYVLGLIMAMVCNSALANKAAIHPYKASEKIQQAAEGAEIFKVDDRYF
jgi:hypothetical protein